MADLIAIEGCIGAGKTTLVDLLALDLELHPVHEAFAENPFLANFYENQQAYALSTELWFLLHRLAQLESASAEAGSGAMVSDYSFYKSYVFSQVTLSDGDLELYNGLFNSLSTKFVQPKALIYLNRPIPDLLKFIALRGRNFERKITAEYLSALSRQYQLLLEKLPVPVLFIELGDVDFLEDVAAFFKIKTAVRELLDRNTSRKIFI